MIVNGGIGVQMKNKGRNQGNIKRQKSSGVGVSRKLVSLAPLDFEVAVAAAMATGKPPGVKPKTKKKAAKKPPAPSR